MKLDVSPRSARGRRSDVLLALVVLVLLGGSGLAVSQVVARQVDMSAEQEMRQRTDALREATSAEVQRYATALTLSAAGLGAAGRPTYDAFATATAPLHDMDLAGATSIVFIAPPVVEKDVARQQRYWRALGSTDLVLEPSPDLGAHAFAVFSDPLDGAATRRTGIDVAAAPAPFAALTEAARSGEVAISEPYELIIDQSLPPEERQTSFSMTAPVLRAGVDGDRLLGWVLLGIRGQDFMGSVLQAASQDSVDVDLLAAGDTGPEAVVEVAEVRSSVEGERDLRRTTVLPVAQRTWTIEVAGRGDALVGTGSYLPRIVLGGALLVALLLAGLTWVLASGRARARVQVRRATRDLVEAEAEARRQAGLLTAVLDSIGDGVGVVDETGAFLIHNPAAKDLLGVDDTDVPAEWQEHYGLFTTAGAPFPQEELPLVRALGGESTDEVEMVVRNRARPDGVRIAVSGRPLDAAGQRGAVAVFRDVTVDREQRAELAAFAGVVAHDLKHPLTVILGFLELIALEAGADSEPTSAHRDRVEHYTARALSTARRMDELISDLLDYTTARDAGFALTELDLGALAHEVLEEQLARAWDGEPPVVHVGALPTVLGDPVRLRQVFANILGNAIKYTAPGQVPRVEITAVTSDGAVTVLFSDRGIEIPRDQRAAIFTPFHRAHTQGYSGTGLGLAICHRVVTRHGGTLTVRDNPGGGSVFEMTLPTPQERPRGDQPAAMASRKSSAPSSAP
ncbi:ATP-binding protein [Nocardioides sp.]|uniref:ATP-binding protein n=1 Tax=Nocardioides sp. TaxID=35761 RepID=UPI00286C798B|nr:ATP-binding protein [Nocardioides sp.]